MEVSKYRNKKVCIHVISYLGFPPYREPGYVASIHVAKSYILWGYAHYCCMPSSLALLHRYFLVSILVGTSILTFFKYEKCFYTCSIGCKLLFCTHMSPTPSTPVHLSPTPLLKHIVECKDTNILVVKEHASKGEDFECRSQGEYLCQICSRSFEKKDAQFFVCHRLSDSVIPRPFPGMETQVIAWERGY